MSESEQDLASSQEALATEAESKPTTGVQAADDDAFECRGCGYIYNPNKGDPSNRVLAGTPFSAVPSTWKCPACTAKKGAFTNIGINSNASGFKENLRYGLGVNNMSAEQKNLLIFGGLALGFVLFLSLYTLG